MSFLADNWFTAFLLLWLSCSKYTGFVTYVSSGTSAVIYRAHTPRRLLTQGVHLKWPLFLETRSAPVSHQSHEITVSATARTADNFVFVVDVVVAFTVRQTFEAVTAVLMNRRQLETLDVTVLASTLLRTSIEGWLAGVIGSTESSDMWWRSTELRDTLADYLTHTLRNVTVNVHAARLERAALELISPCR